MTPKIRTTPSGNPEQAPSMVVQCRQFVQNAWRRDLCANCFKSRDEHREPSADMAPTATRPPPPADSVQGILKGSRQVRSTPSTVRFPSAGEESQVIGVGGLECFCSDDEDDDFGSEHDDASDAAELEPEDEEERALQRLTRSNTDFNTVSGKVELMQLPLGRPRDGRKHAPLVVCVTPFGGSRDRNDGDNEMDNPTATSLSRIPVLRGRTNAAEHPASTPVKAEAENLLPKNSVPIISEQETEKNSDSETEHKSVVTDCNIINGIVRAELRTVEPVESEYSLVKEVVSVESEAPTGNDVNGISEKCSKPGTDTEVNVVTTNVSSEVKVIDDNRVNLNGMVPNSNVCIENKLLITEKAADLEEMKVLQESKTITSSEDSPPKVKRDFYTSKTSEKSEGLMVEQKLSEKSEELSVKVNSSLFKYSQSTNIFSARTHDISSSLLKGDWKGKSVDLLSSKGKKSTSETYKLFKTTDKEVQNAEAASVKSNAEIYKSSIGRNLFATRIRETSRTINEVRQSETIAEGNVVKDKRLISEAKKDLDVGEVIVPSKLEVSPTAEVRSIPEVEREQPDGRAEDPEEEPPASAITAAAPRPSFLHGVKPRLPQKPSTLPTHPMCRVQKQVERQIELKVEETTQQSSPLQQQPSQPPIEQPSQQSQPPSQPLQQPSQQLQRQPVNETAATASVATVSGISAADTRSPHKRQAPRPPSSSTSSASSNSSSSCSPTEPSAQTHELPHLETEEVTQDSLSEEESLTPSTNETSAANVELVMETRVSPPPVSSDKKKGRFSLRKFLRLSSNHHSKDGDTKTNVVESHLAATNADGEDVEARGKVRPLPRPRLEIVHPFSLDGAAVEVVRSPAPLPQQQLPPQSPQEHITMKPLCASTDNLASTDSEMLATDSSSSLDADSPNHSPKERPVRPPPPPRGQLGRGIDVSGCKPVRPPPPRSAELLRQQKSPMTLDIVSRSSPQDSLYANLVPVSGEVRLGLTPDKPQRTASMRDANSDTPKRKSACEDSGYESVEMADGRPLTQTQQVSSDNVYERMIRGRSSPEQGKLKTKKCNSPRRRSDGSIDECGCAKTRPGYLRSSSFTYSAFESDSDTYCPYSFYSGEEGDDDDTDWIPTAAHSCRNSHLRLRKGRSVIHESLEDNYGAVTVANHEALAQVLEQVKNSLVLPVPAALRGLKTVPELRWSNFSIDERVRTLAGRRAFYPALWMGHPVTLSVSAAGRGGGDLPTSRAPMLAPLAQFCDIIPARFLLRPPSVDPEHLVRASVSVLVRLQVDTVQSYGRRLREREHWDEEAASFALLQLVNGLKRLQAQGVEEAPLSLTNFVLCRYEDCQQADAHPHLCALRELGASTAEGAGGASPRGSLCRCALVGLRHLHPAAVATQRSTLLTELLTRGQAASLSQVKSILELWIWGPADAALSGTRTEREQALQRWLDLERATALHELALLRTRPHYHLTTFEESRLFFLVTTSAEILAEASFLLDGSSTVTSDA